MSSNRTGKGSDRSVRDDILATVPSLRAFAISLSGNVDRADDLVQETLLRALANIDSFEPGTNLPAWLFTILRNLFRSDYRKRRREVEDSRRQLCRDAEDASRAEQPHRVPGISRRRLQAAAGSARSADPGRRIRLFLRGSRGDLRLRGRHHQEPRQSRAGQARRIAVDRRRRRLRAGSGNPRRGRRRRRPLISGRRH